MVVNPKPNVVKTLKKLAAAEGISLNAYVTPFLNDIAAGRLVRVPHYPVPERKAA
jgi:predicted HicB family RNase H-like nuclease